MDEAALKAVLNMPSWLGSGLISGVGGVLGLLLLFLFFRWRMGSSYGVTNRLYALLIGGADFNQPSLLQFWQERQDIERFNALFNFRARNLAQIQAFTHWVAQYDLCLHQLARLHSWFDFDTRKIAKPTWHKVLPGLLILVCSYGLLIACLVTVFADSALVKLKGEERLLWLNHQEAMSFSYHPLRSKGSDWVLERGQCTAADFDANTLAATLAIQPATLNSLCQFFASETAHEQLGQLLAQQQSLVWLALLLLLPLWLSLRFLQGAILAWRSRGQLLAGIRAYRHQRQAALWRQR
ncbi:DUF6216 family protein [Balneatrix alpica]|uniref:DUF6216 family protein n=1 Tax=Balneatrix alpica TaxID=75684 RepID=UPI002738ECA9|nr:DUF6216 family protein [Balneatrix alpica]